MTTGNEALLAEMLDGLLGERITPELLAAAEGGALPSDLWTALQELGVTRSVLPEADGGSGLTWPEVRVVAAAAGRYLLPLPLPEHLVALQLCRRAGLPTGADMLTLAPPGHRLSLSGSAGAARVSGTAERVPWGRSADAVVAVVTDADGRDWLLLVDRTAARVTPQRSLAGEPRDHLAFDAAPAEALRLDGAGESLLLFGAAMRAAQIGGALDGILSLTTGHAHLRSQFGRPLAKFQAIQLQLATLAGETAATVAAGVAAFRALGRGDAAIAVAAAKARADASALRGAAIAHQVHGAIGVSQEYRLQHATRRLWSWRGEFGDGRLWRERLGRRVLAGGSAGFWSLLTDAS